MKTNAIGYLLAGVALGLVGSALAVTTGDSGRSLGRGFSFQNSAVDANDVVANTGIVDGANGWQRLTITLLEGAISSSIGSTPVTVIPDQATLYSSQVVFNDGGGAVACTQVTTNAYDSTRVKTTVFNEGDNNKTIFCSSQLANCDGTGTMIPPSTGMAFDAGSRIYCRPVSGVSGGVMQIDISEYYH